MGSCLNKTTLAPVTRDIITTINTDNGPIKISVNEEIKVSEIQRATTLVLTSDPVCTEVGVTVVTDASTERKSSQKPLEVGVVIHASVSLAVIILVAVVVIFAFRWIMKKRPSFSTECDSVNMNNKTGNNNNNGHVTYTEFMRTTLPTVTTKSQDKIRKNVKRVSLILQPNQNLKHMK